MISTSLGPKALKMKARDLKHLYKQSRFRKKGKEPSDSFPIRQSLSVYNLRTLSPERTGLPCNGVKRISIHPSLLFTI